MKGLIIDLSSSFGLQVPPFDGNSLICLSMSTCYLDKSDDHHKPL
jgi:hypothetical protein